MLKTIQNTLEQGQNRLRYALELKEKVVLNTEQTGATKIMDDIESLKGEFDKLVSEVQVSVRWLKFVVRVNKEPVYDGVFFTGLKTEAVRQRKSARRSE